MPKARHKVSASRVDEGQQDDQGPGKVRHCDNRRSARTVGSDDWMSASREQMLQRIREAVAQGNHAGGSPSLPERGSVGYQGAGSDPVARFRQEFSAAGGHTHVVVDHAAARAVVLDLTRTRSAHRVLLGGGDVLAALRVAEPMRTAGMEVIEVGSEGMSRERVFQADLGISGVDYLVAETGSVILASQPNQPRSLSLLPPLHIAIAERRQILPDLFDLFSLIGTRLEELPAALSVITGPSKTGDIELRLVTGVHGPGEIHVVLVDPECSSVDRRV
jgi:L-lactate dehydrogenase complex protein LldG